VVYSTCPARGTNKGVSSGLACFVMLVNLRSLGNGVRVLRSQLAGDGIVPRVTTKQEFSLHSTAQKTETTD
jgi:hypothetical protein